MKSFGNQGYFGNLLGEKLVISRENLTKDQLHALEVMESGKNVFLTGEAGTGKTAVMEVFIHEKVTNFGNLLVTAPTGTAANNLGGETLHRAFHAPVGVLDNRDKIKKRDPVLAITDVVIIDEISMCRFDLFEYVAKRIAYENDIRQKNRFMAKCGIGVEGGLQRDIQLIVVGDFYQLPPVMTQEDAYALQQVYPHIDCSSGYAFKSPYWNLMEFKYINLTEIVRQDDVAFKKILSLVRSGTDKQMCISYLENNSSVTPFDSDEAVYLTGINKHVNEINERRLSELGGMETVFEAESSGDVRDSDKFADDVIRIKYGCRVMITVNSPNMTYINGTMGTVIGISNARIRIITDDGNDVLLERASFDITRPVVDEVERTIREMTPEGDIVIKKITEKVIKHETVGSYSQFPIRLAYAITIHKSQGKTFEKVNINPYCWDPGQFYTAVSRCKTIQGICFVQNILPKYIQASREIEKKFSKQEKKK